MMSRSFQTPELYSKVWPTISRRSLDSARATSSSQSSTEVAKRLLDQDVATRLESHLGQAVVAAGRSRHHHGIDIVEHLLELSATATPGKARWASTRRSSVASTTVTETSGSPLRTRTCFDPQ